MEAVFIIRTVDVLSFSGPSLVIQGSKQSHCGKSGGDKIWIGLVNQYGPAVRPPGDATDAAQSLKRTPVARHEGVWAGLALLRDTEHDDLRIDFSHVFVIQAQTLNGSRREILNQDIGPFHQFLNDRSSARVFKVQAQAEPVVVIKGEVATPVQARETVLVGLRDSKVAGPFARLHPYDRGSIHSEISA